MAATDVSQDRPGELIQESTAVNIKSTKTTIPFVKDNEFDYSWLVPFAKGKTKQLLGWLVFMAMVIFVVVSVSNGVNLTDGSGRPGYRHHCHLRPYSRNTGICLG